MERDLSAAFEFMVGKTKVRIGRFTYGLNDKEIQQWNEGASLEIGSFCSIARGVVFMVGGNHRHDWITTFPFGYIAIDQLGGTDIKGHPSTKGDIIVGNDVWIAYRATIMSGVKIGDGAVIAANSHVVDNIGPYEIWGGNPARKIRERFPEEIKEMLLQLKWWDLSTEQIREIAPQLSNAPDRALLLVLLGRFRPEIDLSKFHSETGPVSGG